MRTIKEDVVKHTVVPRSRLVCIGPNHKEGIDFERADCPTPMFATMLMVLGEGTACVAGSTSSSTSANSSSRRRWTRRAA